MRTKQNKALEANKCYIKCKSRQTQQATDSYFNRQTVLQDFSVFLTLSDVCLISLNEKNIFRVLHFFSATNQDSLSKVVANNFILKVGYFYKKSQFIYREN